MIRALHDALDLQFVHDDIRVCFCIWIAGMKNILFVLLIETKLFQIVLSIQQSNDQIAILAHLHQSPMYRRGWYPRAVRDILLAGKTVVLPVILLDEIPDDPFPFNQFRLPSRTSNRSPRR